MWAHLFEKGRIKRGTLWTHVGPVWAQCGPLLGPMAGPLGPCAVGAAAGATIAADSSLLPLGPSGPIDDGHSLPAVRNSTSSADAHGALVGPHVVRDPADFVAAGAPAVACTTSCTSGPSGPVDIGPFLSLGRSAPSADALGDLVGPCVARDPADLAGPCGPTGPAALPPCGVFTDRSLIFE
jgi:hypothetical protein